MSTGEMRRDFVGSVLDLLLERDQAAYSDCTITPVIPDTEMAKRFGGDDAPALLQLSELTRAESGQIVNRSEAWLAADAFIFQLRRRRES